VPIYCAAGVFDVMFFLVEKSFKIHALQKGACS